MWSARQMRYRLPSAGLAGLVRTVFTHELPESAVPKRKQRAIMDVLEAKTLPT